jgi:hypothetical protein
MCKFVRVGVRERTERPPNIVIDKPRQGEVHRAGGPYDADLFARESAVRLLLAPGMLRRCPIVGKNAVTSHAQSEVEAQQVLGRLWDRRI